MRDSPRAGVAAFVVAIVCAIAAVSPAVASGGGGGYCADQHAVFKDRHAFIGVSDAFVTIASSRFRNCSFGRMAANHIGFYRIGLEWPAIEYAPSTYSFALQDQVVTQLAQHHIQMLGVVFGTPTWLTAAPTGATEPNAYPPRNPNSFAQFMVLLIKRYGPHGSFWRANHKLHYDPIHAWQIWNEPNLKAYWQPSPNARDYVKLLKVADKAIKRADHHSVVVTAGMPALSATEEPSWLNALYKAGMHGAFDALAIHLYGPNTTWAINRIKAARHIMNRHRDRHKSLWVTEFSWAGGPPDVYLPSLHGQRVQASQFLSIVSKNRARFGLGELMWYGWQDHVYGPDPSWWGYHLGLYTASLRAKPALRVLANVAKRLDR